MSEVMKPERAEMEDYRGFVRRNFLVEGLEAWVVEPKEVPAARPWIWRAEFWDHEPQVDVGLLEKGFHVGFIKVGNTFGCPAAVRQFDAFYLHVTERFTLAKRMALEGLSRGGLYCYRFGGLYPERVACIYADNAVCDFKSWPGGKGTGSGSAEDWTKLLVDYGFTSEQEALEWGGNPVDHLVSLARAGVPVLHVCGDADVTVPYAENSAIVKERYRGLGGSYEEMMKPGMGHHPHSLVDPTAIVDFIFRHAAGG